MTETLPGGTPVPVDEQPWAPVREVIETALVLCNRVPEAREPGVSAGYAGAPSRWLGQYIEEQLQVLHGATARQQSPAQWLADTLGVPLSQLPETGARILAALLDATSDDPTLEFEVPPMTDEEDITEAEEAEAASVMFGSVRTDLVREDGTP